MATGIPAGLPAGSARNAQATLAGAVAVSREVGGPQGDALSAAARDSFAHGLGFVSGISATLVIATSVVTFVLLRRFVSSAERVSPAA